MKTHQQKVKILRLESLGKNIRKYRKEKKLRQEDVAERSGLSTNYIGMVERGEKVPSLESFISILNALEISADMVLSEVLLHGYKVQDSLLDEKLATLSKAERDRIYDVIDTMIKHA